MVNKIAAGIIGTGFIGPAHVEAGRRLGNIDFIALAEANLDLARAKADLLCIERVYGDYRELLADRDVRVVHNCTPNHLHYQVNKDILAAGKHVISEKPLAMTSAESRELVQLAKDSGLVHAVDFNYRYYPLVQHAREMVRRGELGDVFALHGSYLQDWLYLATDWNWRLEPEMSGASRAVADVGSHWCALLQFLTGESITRVMADLRTIHNTRMKPKKEIETYAGKELEPSDYEPQEIHTEDYASVLLELSGGAHGVFTVSQVSAGRKNRLYFELDGSRCTLAWDQENPNEMWIGYREKPNEILIKDPSLLHEAAKEYAHYPGGHPEAYPDGPKNLFRNVYRAIEAGQMPAEPDWSTFEDGHKEMAICDAVLESNQAQCWTDVKY
jgi:predicted dehydrogenase